MISLTSTSAIIQHARDAKRWAESEFKKQLDHKVYQVLEYL